eukprot:16505-Heterococcus_DN1.PRE.7
MALDAAWKDCDAVYMSYDIDSLDAAFVPGTGWPEPGGLLPREAHKLVGGVAKEGLCGMELVERHLALWWPTARWALTSTSLTSHSYRSKQAAGINCHYDSCCCAITDTEACRTSDVSSSTGSSCSCVQLSGGLFIQAASSAILLSVCTWFTHALESDSCRCEHAL